MEETKESDESVYDYFFDAIEDITMPALSSNQFLSEMSDKKGSSQMESSQNLLQTFIKMCNQMNCIESSDSLSSLSSFMSTNSDSNLVGLNTFFTAMETVSFPNSESKNILNEDYQTFILNYEKEDLDTNDISFRLIFNVVDNFLHNQVESY
jgi:hypothetical protein